MGREIRRVPPDWQHPRNNDGNYHPQHDLSYRAALDDWIRSDALWQRGEHPDQHADWAESAKDCAHFAQWAGDPPDVAYYRTREWTPEEATAYQVYEDTSEGTPISPVLLTEEETIRWLVEDGSQMGVGGATYRMSRKAAIRFIRGPGTATMVAAGGRLMSGAEWADEQQKSAI